MKVMDFWGFFVTPFSSVRICAIKQQIRISKCCFHNNPMRSFDQRTRSSDYCSTSRVSVPETRFRQNLKVFWVRTRVLSASSAAESGAHRTSGSEIEVSPSARAQETLSLLNAQVEKLSVIVKMQQEELQSMRSVNRGTPHAHPLTKTWSAQNSSPGTWRGAGTVSPFDNQRIGIGDRRLLGLYDARFHSTAAGATPKDYRVLPDRIFLVRHAESEGNVDSLTYQHIPDSQVPLTERGHNQARTAGQKIRDYIEQRGGRDYKLFCYLSPYKRSLQTYESMSLSFASGNILGIQEEVQLREQDFGNFQDAEGKQHEKADRLRFGRFYYRFPNGESGADVYDRITIFEDHMIRDINAGRFANHTNLVLVTHGLALRVFLMRWFHWSLNQYLMVHNPPNAEPLILERVPSDVESQPGGSVTWMHTKALYRLTDESLSILRGCTPEMAMTSIMPRRQNDMRLG